MSLRCLLSRMAGRLVMPGRRVLPLRERLAAGFVSIPSRNVQVRLASTEHRDSRKPAQPPVVFDRVLTDEEVDYYTKFFKADLFERVTEGSEWKSPELRNYDHNENMLDLRLWKNQLDPRRSQLLEMQACRALYPDFDDIESAVARFNSDDQISTVQYSTLSTFLQCYRTKGALTGPVIPHLLRLFLPHHTPGILDSTTTVRLSSALKRQADERVPEVPELVAALRAYFVSMKRSDVIDSGDLFLYLTGVTASVSATKAEKELNFFLRKYRLALKPRHFVTLARAYIGNGRLESAVRVYRRAKQKHFEDFGEHFPLLCAYHTHPYFTSMLLRAMLQLDVKDGVVPDPGVAKEHYLQPSPPPSALAPGAGEFGGETGPESAVADAAAGDRLPAAPRAVSLGLSAVARRTDNQQVLANRQAVDIAGRWAKSRLSMRAEGAAGSRAAPDGDIDEASSPLNQQDHEGSCSIPYNIHPTPVIEDRFSPKPWADPVCLASAEWRTNFVFRELLYDIGKCRTNMFDVVSEAVEEYFQGTYTVRQTMLRSDGVCMSCGEQVPIAPMTLDEAVEVNSLLTDAMQPHMMMQRVKRYVTPLMSQGMLWDYDCVIDGANVILAGSDNEAYVSQLDQVKLLLPLLDKAGYHRPLFVLKETCADACMAFIAARFKHIVVPDRPRVLDDLVCLKMTAHAVSQGRRCLLVSDDRQHDKTLWFPTTHRDLWRKFVDSVSVRLSIHPHARLETHARVQPYEPHFTESSMHFAVDPNQVERTVDWSYMCIARAHGDEPAQLEKTFRESNVEPDFDASDQDWNDQEGMI